MALNRKINLLIITVLNILLLTSCTEVDPNQLEETIPPSGGDLVIRNHMYKTEKDRSSLGEVSSLTDILKKMDEEKASGIWNVTGDKILTSSERGGMIGEGDIEGIPLGYNNSNYPQEDNIARMLFEKLPTMGNVVPAGTRVTSGWGIRKVHPVLKITRAHDGIDFGVGMGTPITSAWDGEVTFAARSGGYGKLLKINHGSGIETRYAHLNGFNVKVGDKVTKGQIVARSGNTGIGTGAHLHFEIRYNGKSRNPYYFFQDKDVTNLVKYNQDGR